PAISYFYHLSLHDALPIFILFVLVRDDQDKRRVGFDAEFFWTKAVLVKREREFWWGIGGRREHRTENDGQEDNLEQPYDTSHRRSEEHTSELQSPDHLVCR